MAQPVGTLEERGREPSACEPRGALEMPLKGKLVHSLGRHLLITGGLMLSLLRSRWFCKYQPYFRAWFSKCGPGTLSGEIKTIFIIILRLYLPLPLSFSHERSFLERRVF